MVNENRLAELLLQATSNLEKAVKAKAAGNSKVFSEKIWEVGADLEYLTFIVGLNREDSDESWKGNVKFPRAVDVDGELSTIQKLLKEALSAIDINIKEVYERAWLARGHMLRIQRALERATSKQSQ